MAQPDHYLGPMADAASASPRFFPWTGSCDILVRELSRVTRRRTFVSAPLASYPTGLRLVRVSYPLSRLVNRGSVVDLKVRLIRIGGP